MLPTTPSCHVETAPVAGRIGLEIRGVRLAMDMDDDLLRFIRQALLRYKVIFFSGQHQFDDDAMMRLMPRFGSSRASGNSAEGAAAERIPLPQPGVWATVGSYLESPPAALMARALDAAPVMGSDMLWANTVTSHAELSRPLRELAGSLCAHHTNVRELQFLADQNSAELFAGSDGCPCDAHHPVVRVHPETGERALLLGSHAQKILDVPSGDSGRLLELLQGRVTRPENTVRWRFRSGDVVLWDSRATQYYVCDNGCGSRGSRWVAAAGTVPVDINGNRRHSTAAPATQNSLPQGVDNP